jgi:chromosome segregation ATPase
MDLKELLGEELYNKVIEKLGDKKIDIVNDGRWIPKAKFDDVNEEKKQYKEQVDNLNKELGKLQKQLEDNQAANETIEKLKQQIKDKEAEMEKIRKQNAIKFEVLKYNPNDVADILPHLKEDTVTIAEDGTITGLKEQLDALKESKPYLFKQVEPVGTGGSLGGGEKKKQPAGNDSKTDFINAIREVQAKRD